MRRVWPDTVKIEHLLPQNPDEGSGDALALSYDNMLGVCDGLKGFPKKHQTCDSHKGNSILAGLNPLDESSVDKIAYRSDGTIFSDDKVIEDDLNCILNLNCERAHLKENRRAAIVQLQNYLREKNPQGAWNMSLLRQILRHYETEVDGAKPEYLGAVLYFIKRYMRRAR